MKKNKRQYLVIPIGIVLLLIELLIVSITIPTSEDSTDSEDFISFIAFVVGIFIFVFVVSWLLKIFKIGDD